MNLLAVMTSSYCANGAWLSGISPPDSSYKLGMGVCIYLDLL
jgi:hypothetical protein